MSFRCLQYAALWDFFLLFCPGIITSFTRYFLRITTAATTRIMAIAFSYQSLPIDLCLLYYYIALIVTWYCSINLWTEVIANCGLTTTGTLKSYLSCQSAVDTYKTEKSTIRRPIMRQELKLVLYYVLDRVINSNCNIIASIAKTKALKVLCNARLGLWTLRTMFIGEDSRDLFYHLIYGIC